MPTTVHPHDMLATEGVQQKAFSRRYQILQEISRRHSAGEIRSQTRSAEGIQQEESDLTGVAMTECRQATAMHTAKVKTQP